MVDYNDWRSCTADADAPAYVKSASFPDAPAPLARSFFADQTNGELPCNSREEIWASAHYFRKHAEEDHYRAFKADIEYNLQKAAETFGIADDIAKVLTHTEAVKQASDEDYGWVRDGVRKYPMFDAHGVKLAASYFEENKFKYGFPMRQEIARNILKKAEQYDVLDLPDGIRKSAGYGVARPDNVINELTVRAELCHDVDTALALAKMAEHVAEKGCAALTGTTDKIAELVEDVDVIENWRGRYGKDMTAPEDFLFDMDVKAAEALVNDTIELSGDVLSLSKLAELPDSTFDDVLGEGFAESVKEAGAIDPKKLGEALAARPVEDRNELSHALKRL